MGDNPCSMCSAPVATEQLASGLAVRISGQVVCPHCVDLLPVDAKVRINQLRALRGQAATTYRYRHPRFPGLKAYTFSTSAQIMHHRRLLNGGKELEAPEIAPRSTAAATPRGTAAAASDRKRLLAIGGVGGGLLLVLLLVTVAALGGGDDQRTEPPSDPVIDAATTTIDLAGATRADYPRRAGEAWAQAAAELPVDHPVLAAIADEVATERRGELDLAAEAIAGGQLLKAQDLLDRSRLAPHVLLRALERRELDLRAALDDARAALAAAQPEPVVAPEPVPVAPQPEPEPGPPPSTTQPTPEPTPVVTAPEPEPEPEPAPPPTEAPPPTVLIAPAAALAAAPGTGDWSADGSALVLDGRTALASRRAELPAKTLRLWLELAPEPPASTVVVGRIGEEQARLVQPAAGWVALDPAIAVAGGPTRIELLARGSGLRIERVAVVEDGVDPGDAPVEGSLAWVDAPEDQDLGVVTALAPQWGREVGFYEAFKPGSVVPQGLPGGVDPRIARSDLDRRHHQLRVPLGGIDLRGGGLALLLHGFGDPARLELETWLVDRGGRRLPTQPVLFTGAEWQTALLSLPETDPAQFDATAVSELVLRDASDDSLRPFLVAKVVAVAGRAPTSEDLGIEPRALRLAGPQELEQLLDAIADRRRSRRDWRKVLDIDKLRILAGHQLVTGSWHTQVYDELEQRTGSRPAPGTLAPLLMHDPWLDETFIIREIINDRSHDIVVVATAGVEFPTGLSVDQALHNFWIKMIEEATASGMLPVAVLGPTKVVPAQQDQADELWERLDQVLRERFPAIPVIDLRPVGRAHFARFGPGQAAQSAAMLAGAVVELQERLRLLHEAGARR